MDGDKTMIVAGIGFRQAAEADEIVTLVERALGLVSLVSGALDGLATVAALAALPAFREAAERLGAMAIHINTTDLAAAGSGVHTVSARSLAAHGVGSVAEAAALAGAGRDAVLILNRVASPAVTCALARSLATPEGRP
jgi:cobalt-precorrin 5A hydrolase